MKKTKPLLIPHWGSMHNYSNNTVEINGDCIDDDWLLACLCSAPFYLAAEHRVQRKALSPNLDLKQKKHLCLHATLSQTPFWDFKLQSGNRLDLSTSFVCVDVR